MTERANRWVMLTAVFLLGLVGGTAISGMWRTGKESARSVIFSQTSGTLPVRVLASISSAPEVAETNEEQAKEESEPPATHLQAALGIADVLERRQNLERLGVEWANADVDEAITALANVRGLADRTALIQGIFHSLSGRGPKDALNAVLRLEGASDRLAARKELIAAWAPGTWVDDPKRNAYLVSRYGSGGLGLQLLLVSPPQDELAILWANSLEANEGKVRLLTEIADGFVFRKSPAEALKLGEGLEGEDYVSFLEGFAASYAKQDGKAALEWSLQIADLVLKENLQQSINSKWVEKNPSGAKAYLQTLEYGPVRESLMRAVAANLAETDTSAALAWIQELPTVVEQELAWEVVKNIAPVGIGTQLSMDGGLPIVSSLVTTGSAALSQQIRTGDRIAGIDSYGGGFVSTAGMDLRRVVELIRGQPGTSVRLQISRANAHGFDPPRVVILPRSQVLHSPGK